MGRSDKNIHKFQLDHKEQFNPRRFLREVSLESKFIDEIRRRLRSLSFEELFGYLDYCLSGLEARRPEHHVNLSILYANLDELFELLELKVNDSFASESARLKFYREYEDSFAKQQLGGELESLEDEISQLYDTNKNLRRAYRAFNARNSELALITVWDQLRRLPKGVIDAKGLLDIGEPEKAIFVLEEQIGLVSIAPSKPGQSNILAKEQSGASQLIKIPDLSDELANQLDSFSIPDLTAEWPDETFELPVRKQVVASMSEANVNLSTVALSPKLNDANSRVSTLFKELLLILENDLPILMQTTTEDISRKKSELCEVKTRFLNSLDPEQRRQLRLQAKLAFERRIDTSTNWAVRGRYERIVGLRSRRKKILLNLNTQANLLPFEIFPAGPWLPKKLAARYRKIGISLREVELQRFQLIWEHFEPSRYFFGHDGGRNYNGYIVFVFDNTECVIVENPLYGNATYVINGTWAEILKTLQHSRSEVRRMPHTQYVIHRDPSQWLRELELAFRYRRGF